jgi:hypothetical protein
MKRGARSRCSTLSSGQFNDDASCLGLRFQASLAPYLVGAVTVTTPSACITASCKAGRVSAIL